MTGATPSDDSFHLAADSDPFWTETSWFGFNVPGRRLAGAVYPVFRPNLGVCSAGVFVWDDTGIAPHEVLYAKNWWHLPMPEHDLTVLDLPNGLRYEMLEPLRRYRVRFDDPDGLQLDLSFEALHEPHAPMVGATGHIDQAMRVRGSLTLHGDEIEVDGFDMRDRSWSVRKDSGQVRAGYDYGISESGAGFLAMSIGAGDEQPVISGFHLVDGVAHPITSGLRSVERTEGRPSSLRLQLTDATGTELAASGAARNHFAFQSSPNYFAWMSLAEWSLDDGSSTATDLWGQAQDVWSPDLLRADRLTRR